MTVETDADNATFREYDSAGKLVGQLSADNACTGNAYTIYDSHHSMAGTYYLYYRIYGSSILGVD